MPKIISKSSFKGLNSLMEDNYKYLELKFPEECLFNINDAFENFKNDMDQTLEGVQKLIFDLAKSELNKQNLPLDCKIYQTPQKQLNKRQAPASSSVNKIIKRSKPQNIANNSTINNVNQENNSNFINKDKLIPQINTNLNKKEFSINSTPNRTVRTRLQTRLQKQMNQTNNQSTSNSLFNTPNNSNLKIKQTNNKKAAQSKLIISTISTPKAANKKPDEILKNSVEKMKRAEENRNRLLANKKQLMRDRSLERKNRQMENQMKQAKNTLAKGKIQLKQIQVPSPIVKSKNMPAQIVFLREETPEKNRIRFQERRQKLLQQKWEKFDADLNNNKNKINPSTNKDINNADLEVKMNNLHLNAQELMTLDESPNEIVENTYVGASSVPTTTNNIPHPPPQLSQESLSPIIPDKQNVNLENITFTKAINAGETPIQNRTFMKIKESTMNNYQLTPPPPPAPLMNYDISHFIDSEDEEKIVEHEKKSKHKPIPKWAKSKEFANAIRLQYSRSNAEYLQLVSEIFKGPPKGPVDLDAMNLSVLEKYQQRSSSICWNSKIIDRSQMSFV